MKKRFKEIALMLCFTLFMTITLIGCSLDSSETKDAVALTEEEQKEIRLHFQQNNSKDKEEKLRV